MERGYLCLYNPSLKIRRKKERNMQNSNVWKRAVAWLLALIAIITSVPNLSYYGLFADEEITSENTEAIVNTEEGNTESNTEVVNSTEESTETSTESRTEISTEISTEQSAESSTEIAETETAEPQKGNLYVKVNEGGEISFTLNGETVTVHSEENRTLIKDNGGNDIDVTDSLVNGFCLVKSEEAGTVVATETTPKTNYVVAAYRVLSDAGEEIEDTSDFVSSSDTYKRDIIITEQDRYLDITFHAVETVAQGNENTENTETATEVENGTTTGTEAVESVTESEQKTGLARIIDKVKGFLGIRSATPKGASNSCTVSIHEEAGAGAGTYVYEVHFDGGDTRTGVCVSPSLNSPLSDKSYSFGSWAGSSDKNAQSNIAIAALATCPVEANYRYGQVSIAEGALTSGTNNAIGLFSGETDRFRSGSNPWGSSGFTALHGYLGDLYGNGSGGYPYPNVTDALKNWIEDNADIMPYFSLTKTNGEDRQDICSLFFNPPPNGNLKLSKVPTKDDPVAQAVKKLNTYDLYGVELEVFKDAACKEKVDPEKYIKDADGTEKEAASTMCYDKEGGVLGTYYQLEAGTYYIKETAAAQAGYRLSDKVVEVKIDGDKEIEFENPPYLDPARIKIKKQDSCTGNTPAKGCTLEGAEYTVKYYDELLGDGTDFSRYTPKETFVFKTVKSGDKYVADWRIKNCVKSSTNTAFTNAGRYPIGTYVVKETKAPKGYKKDPNTYVRVLEYDSETDKGTWSSGQFETGNTIESMHEVSDPSITSKEEPKGFDIEFDKVDAQVYPVSNEKNPQGTANFAGVKFRVYYAGNGKTDPDEIAKDTVYSKQRKTPVGRNDWVAEFTAGADGQVKSTGGTFLKGNYYVKEYAEGIDYLLNPDKSISFSSSDLGDDFYDKTFTLTDVFDNPPKRGSVQLIKIDKETPDGVAQGDADLTGIRFAIRLDPSVPQYPVFDPYGNKFLPGQDVAYITTHKDATGKVVAELPSESYLPAGYYTLRELPSNGTLANNSYHLTDGSEYQFLIDAATPYNTYQRAFVGGREIKFEDAVVRGGVSVQKVDEDLNRNYAQGDATLEGAVFAIRYVSTTGQVVKVDGNFYRYGDIVKRYHHKL